MPKTGHFNSRTSEYTSTTRGKEIVNFCQGFTRLEKTNIHSGPFQDV